MNILQRRADLADKIASRIGQRNAAGGAVEQAHAKLPFELPDGVAQGGGGDAQIDRRRPEGPPARDRDYRVEFDQTMPHHYPAFRNSASRSIPIIMARVYR